MKKSHNRWSLTRFCQTLNYFKIIPGISLWQNLWQRQQHNIPNNQPVMKHILLVNSLTNLSQTIFKFLIEKQHKITLLNLEKNNQVAKIPSEVFMSYLLESYSSKNLSSNLFKNIDQIIYFIDKSQAANHNEFKDLLDYVVNKSFPHEEYIFDFTNYNSSIKELWGAVDDVVMGGVSASQIQIINNQAVFSGYVSTNNNGGFASVRTRNFDPVMNLENYEGIELKVRGDGQRYKFIMRGEGTWDGIGYCYSFDTVKDSFQTIRIPFADLIPVFRAKTVKEATTFNSNQVYSMQLMLSKFEYDGELNPTFKPGNFKLEVEYIKAYSQTFQPNLILVSNLDDQEITSSTSNDYLQQENMVRDSGLNYNIIRSYNSPEYIADQVFYLQEPNDNTNKLKEELIAKICLDILDSNLAANKTFEVRDYTNS